MDCLPAVISALLLVHSHALLADDAPEAQFSTMTPGEVRAYERDTLRRAADLTLIPPVLNTSPSPQYDYDKLDNGMTIGIERTSTGQLWACWVADGDSPKTFVVLATSDDDGETWSKPRRIWHDWIEHMFVERRDRSLWMLARTKKGIMQSRSTDGGRAWTEPTKPPVIRHPDGEILLARREASRVAEPPKLLPAGWNPKAAADEVLARLVRVSAPQVKGAHDAEFVCVGDRAYVVEHDNDVAPGHGAGKAMYCVLTEVNLKTLAVEKTHLLAKAGQVFANVTLPDAQMFVPRIVRKDERTLRCYFCSQPAKEQAVTWYRDFDLRTQAFADSIHKVKLKTSAGTFDMEPRHFHADAAAKGFAKSAVNRGLYIFDSFKEFDGRRYVALNNFEGKQNALAMLLNDFATFEIIGHYNEPQSEQLSESAVNRLPDGTWMAICRNDKGNYHFTTSTDGRTWSVGEPRPFVPNGLNSKPTFDRFGGVYYLGWQENTKVADCGRSVFNVDVSRDGTTWERKYRFESPHSFQYPTFHEHEGTIWLAVTQSDHKGSSDRIMFGRLE